MIYLASQSPRRAELLSQIGIPFEKVSVHVPEVRADNETPTAYVQRLAIDKARAGAMLKAGALVLGADTIVECEGQVLEKPRNEKHAAEMLALLSDNSHLVHTAVAVAKHGNLSAICVSSKVTFRAITPDEAARYWATGEPADKAGGYGIQGFGGVFVANLEGSYSGVMGLPVAQTQQLLATFGVPCWQPVS